MSSWSPREAIAAWWDDCRGQTEPIAAIVAVLAVGVGLALYAGVAADEQPTTAEADADATMERLTATAVEDGTLDPFDAMDAETYLRHGETANVTVRFEGKVLAGGPAPPADADVAHRPVTIRTADGEGVPGIVILEVWTS